MIIKGTAGTFIRILYACGCTAMLDVNDQTPASIQLCDKHRFVVDKQLELLKSREMDCKVCLKQETKPQLIGPK